MYERQWFIMINLIAKKAVTTNNIYTGNIK